MAILGRKLKPHSWILPGLLAALLFSEPEPAAAQMLDEYEVKAAFLFNFTKFVEWPAQVGPAAAFVIGILGDDPFGSAIERLTRGKAVQGRRIEVRRLKQASEARECQIVFLRSVEKDKTSSLIEAVAGTSVLTVGENQDFTHMGGIVYLEMKEKSVGVVINPEAAERANLKISAKLLSLATIYRDDRKAVK